MVGRDRNIFGPEFRRHFVRKYRAQLLGQLGSQWGNFYNQVMQDKALVRAASERAPEILEWLELRREMVMSAERLDVMPEVIPPLFAGEVPPSGDAANQVQGMIRFLHELQDRYRQAVQDRTFGHRRKDGLEAMASLARFYVAELARYGIDCEGPENAARQFSRSYPQPEAAPPEPSFYEQVRILRAGGEQTAGDPVRERLLDLHREKAILSQKRQEAVSRSWTKERNEIDNRLEAIRRESSEFLRFMNDLGETVEFPDDAESASLGEESRGGEAH
jgi:hypothetical protein